MLLYRSSEPFSCICETACGQRTSLTDSGIQGNLAKSSHEARSTQCRCPVLLEIAGSWLPLLAVNRHFLCALNHRRRLLLLASCEYHWGTGRRSLVAGIMPLAARPLSGSSVRGSVQSRCIAPRSRVPRCSRQHRRTQTVQAAKTADGPSVAIVGVTGAVGQEFLRVSWRLFDHVEAYHLHLLLAVSAAIVHNSCMLL